MGKLIYFLAEKWGGKPVFCGDIIMTVVYLFIFTAVGLGLVWLTVFLMRLYPVVVSFVLATVAFGVYLVLAGLKYKRDH